MGKSWLFPGRFSLKANHPLTLKLVEQTDFFRNYPTIIFRNYSSGTIQAVENINQTLAVDGTTVYFNG